MKKLRILLLLIPVGLYAQQPVELIRANHLKADIFFLAADEMAGRKTASNEARIAANYAASEFLRLGLKPLGDNDTYFQTYDLVKAVQDDAAISLTAQFTGIEKTYQINHDFDPDFSSNTSTIATAPVVFLGYGIGAPEYGYNDLSGIDLKGKIALILSHEPQEFDEHSKFKGKWNTLHAYGDSKFEVLRKAGAAGVLVIRESNPHRPPDKPSGPHDWDMTTPLYALAGRTLDFPIDDINEDVADELLATSGKTVSSLQRAIDASFRPQSFVVPGVTVTIRKELKERQVVHGRNVIAMLEGSDPALKKEYVIVSAHYDHVGVVQGRIYRGADDNASGVAGVLEVARAYALGKVKPKRSVVFLLFDSEEEGLLGAFYYVSHPVLPLGQTVAVLNSDMIGRDENTPTWPNIAATSHNSVNLTGTLYNPELRQVIEQSNHDIHLDLDFKTDTSDPEEWFDRSDHFPFAVNSVPMVLFTTGEHADYHTENDTWDKINYPKLEKIARLIFLSSVELANASGKLKFVP
jgi:hypothetical protein